MYSMFMSFLWSFIHSRSQANANATISAKKASVTAAKRKSAIATNLFLSTH